MVDPTLESSSTSDKGRSAHAASAGRGSSKASGPIQFTTLNRWRRERSMLEVFLVNGQRLVGRIRSFDRFSMLLDMPAGGCFVFHHTVSTVQPAGKGSTRRTTRPGRERELDEGASRRDPAQPKSYASSVGSGKGNFPPEPVRRPATTGSPAPVVKVERRKRRTIQRDPD